jgi:chemotaxis-related protein WspD
MNDVAEMNALETAIDDCWNRIGVWGTETPRCPKLEQFVHCRNCEVYSAAGRLVLERRLPTDYEASWAREYAKTKEQQAVGTESVTLFRLGEEWMALPTHIIQEITDIGTIHSIPHRSTPILRGLVNLRGQLKLCVSLGQLMEIDKAERVVGESKQRTYERMVAVTHHGSDFVFPVSEVRGTWRYRPEDLKEPPSTLSQARGTYTRGILSWDEKDVACLDAELMFYSLEKKLS